MICIAAKILSLVEVSADASNQHEFNAGLLRKALVLPEERTEGRLEFVYVDDDDDPESEQCDYTLYDARESMTHRGSEYRLYFTSGAFQQYAAPGDILIVLRVSGGTALRALVVARNSSLGKALSTILAHEHIELQSRFKAIQAAVGESNVANLLDVAAEHTPTPDAAAFLKHADDSFIGRVLATGRMPSTAAMAAEAARIVRLLNVGAIDPDNYLHWCLEAETALFKRLEQQLGQEKLDTLQRVGPISFGEVTALVMSQLQSRKTRRGHSLQHHFKAILDDRRIVYEPQCQTEPGETPDFVFPGCNEYHDAFFPPERLRMVACKSTLKDRRRQPLSEAGRISEKYILTLDPELTTTVLASMTLSHLRLFMPDALIQEHYAGDQRRHIGNIANLVSLLEAASG